MRNVHSIILFAVLTFTSFGAEALPGAGHGNLEALPGTGHGNLEALPGSGHGDD